MSILNIGKEAIENGYDAREKDRVSKEEAAKARAEMEAKMKLMKEETERANAARKAAEAKNENGFLDGLKFIGKATLVGLTSPLWSTYMAVGKALEGVSVVGEAIAKAAGSETWENRFNTASTGF